MTSAIETKLEAMGLALPHAPAPAANYVPWTVSGSTVYVAGQVPLKDGKVAVTGRLGDQLGLEQGQEAARICALNILAQVKAACGGDLGRVRRCLKLGGFVSSAPDFFDHPKVINGASDLIVEVMGDAGKHARFALGVAALPLNSAVEIDAIFEIA